MPLHLKLLWVKLSEGALRLIQGSIPFLHYQVRKCALAKKSLQLALKGVSLDFRTRTRGRMARPSLPTLRSASESVTDIQHRHPNKHIKKISISFDC